MNEVMEMMNQAALNISTISEQMGIVAGQIKSLNAKQIDHNRITDLENWKAHHIETERVSRDQARRIRGAVHARVNHVLGIEMNGGLVKKEHMSIDKKYRGGVLQQMLQRCQKVQ